jgi:glycosyltransferase involved in cell wall biosynthesis
VKKISIVTPVFNEGRNLKRFFLALKKLDYENEDLELILVDDGSADDSVSVINQQISTLEIKCTLIELGKNKGRAFARETGIKNSSYEHILFLDVKCRIEPDALKNLGEIDGVVIVGNAIDDGNSLFTSYFSAIRRRLYAPYWGENFPDVKITEENFDKIPKGTGILFSPKVILVECMIKDTENPNISDDTLLLKNIVEKYSITKTSKVKVYYLVREKFDENVKHLYERGPKFVNYYIYRGTRYTYIIFTTYILGLLLIIGSLVLGLVPYLIVSLLLINIIIALVLMKGFKEFYSVLLLNLVIPMVFFAGITKGLIIEMKCKIKN